MSVVINPFIVSGRIPEVYFCDRVEESAQLELLEYDLITRKEKTYSLSDSLMNLWLSRR